MHRIAVDVRSGDVSRISPFDAYALSVTFDAEDRQEPGRGLDVLVSAEGFVLNGRAARDGAVLASLIRAAIADANRNPVARLNASAEVPFGRVVRALDALARNRIRDLWLSPSPRALSDVLHLRQLPP